MDKIAEPDVREHVSTLMAISNAMVALHKEQFGRGPTRARSDFAGPDGLLCVLEDALLPAEHAIVGRRVRSFTSATDPDAGVVFEVFSFDPA